MCVCAFYILSWAEVRAVKEQKLIRIKRFKLKRNESMLTAAKYLPEIKKNIYICVGFILIIIVSSSCSADGVSKRAKDM